MDHGLDLGSLSGCFLGVFVFRGLHGMLVMLCVHCSRDTRITTLPTTSMRLDSYGIYLYPTLGSFVNTQIRGNWHYVWCCMETTRKKSHLAWREVREQHT